MSLKRTLAESIGRMLGVCIVPKHEVWTLVERGYLQQFFSALAVDCVFDVGAHEGQYARRIRAAGFKGPIISFEPIPHLAAALRDKARADGNWFVEEVALAEAERETSFNIMASRSFSSMLEPDHHPDAPMPGNRIADTVSLKTGVLATFLRDYRRKLGTARPFLKMDAQGAEVLVAKGAGELLRDFVGIQSEVSFVRLYRGQPDYRAAIDFYRENGFELAALMPIGPPEPQPRLIEMDCLLVNTRFQTT